MNVFKRLFGSRTADSAVERFLKGRKELLSSAEHFRAFAPDPRSDFIQLSDRNDNSQALEKLKSISLSLVHVSSGADTTLCSLAPITVLFVTPWDTYSAVAIGRLKKRVDSRAISAFAVIYFESQLEDIRARTAGSWYFKNVYCVATGSMEVASLIGRVPLELAFGPDGILQQVKEGIGA